MTIGVAVALDSCANAPPVSAAAMVLCVVTAAQKLQLYVTDWDVKCEIPLVELAIDARWLCFVHLLAPVFCLSCWLLFFRWPL